MRPLSALALVLFLAACAPVDRATDVPGSSTAVGTPLALTVSVGTAVPVFVSPLPPGATMPPFPTQPAATPIPTLPSGATPTELKYQVLAQYPNLFYCDPDYYPVARADEADLARQRFPELQANAEEFQAILKHNGLAGLTSFSDEEKLLIYREHKRLAAIYFETAGDQYRFQLQVEEQSGQGAVITGLIDGRGGLTIEKKEPTITTCPICLAAQTRIDTPAGAIAVQALRPGDPIWTMGANGARVRGTVLETVRVFVPSHHIVIHLVLEDGRELSASAGHPTGDGRSLGELNVGDWLNGARIARVERVSYTQPATFDVRPSGDTGYYWANGVLLGSTLAAAP